MLPGLRVSPSFVLMAGDTGVHAEYEVTGVDLFRSRCQLPPV